MLKNKCTERGRHVWDAFCLVESSDLRELFLLEKSAMQEDVTALALRQRVDRLEGEMAISNQEFQRQLEHRICPIEVHHEFDPPFFAT